MATAPGSVFPSLPADLGQISTNLKSVPVLWAVPPELANLRVFAGSGHLPLTPVGVFGIAGKNSLDSFPQINPDD